MFRKRREDNPNQRMMELGPTAMVDLNQITAVYIKMGNLVIRIGGMGVIELSPQQLHNSTKETYEEMAKVILK